MTTTTSPAPVHHVDMTRVLDLGLLCLASPVWIPLLACLAVAVGATAGRPVLFRQTRVGRDGRTFEMLKFRSMLVGDNPLVPDATRITPIGHVLRRTSLDELPQLIHVLRGEMSLVGPRPMLPQQAAELNGEATRRTAVRPGLTGLAQIAGRNTLRWEERFRHDLEWVEQPSARVYFSTLRRTVRVILTGDGVAGHDATDRFVQEVA